MMEVERLQMIEARRHVAFAGGGFFLACVAAVAAIHFRELRGWAMIGAIAVPVCAYIYFVRETNRRGALTRSISSAQLRYNRRMLVVSLVYVAALGAAVWFSQAQRPAGPILWLVAIVPALPVIGMIAVMMRLLVEETDEYLKARTAAFALIATGFMLAVTTVWGFLETFGLVPHVPAWSAFVLWCAGLGVASGVQWLRKT